MQYKATIDKLKRESLQYQSKEATLIRKAISVEATVASPLEKWQGQKTRADDLADEIVEAHHSIDLIQKKLNQRYKYI